MSSYFTLRHSRSAKMLSSARPRPSMLIWMPSAFTAGELGARELAAPVRIEDVWFAIEPERLIWQFR